jgi:hypothetical protein
MSTAHREKDSWPAVWSGVIDSNAMGAARIVVALNVMLFVARRAATRQHCDRVGYQWHMLFKA